MNAPRETSVAVIGGGLVGAAVAVGLAWRGQNVTIFDEGDVAYRASRGNFGLVWVQTKGVEMPEYAHWTRRSAAGWPEFARRIGEISGKPPELSQPGGMILYLSDDEAEAAVGQLSRLRESLGGDYPFEYLGHNALKRLLPAIGPQVVGGTFHPEDGHVNPLYLLRGLYAAFQEAGGRLSAGATVEDISRKNDAFRIRHGDAEWTADRVVLCAGLSNARLAPMVGLDAPVKPNRGQVLITEKVDPFLDFPTVHVRQTGEGAVQIGDSKEDVGMDDGTRLDVIKGIAQRAVRQFPVLESVRVLRSWGALRVMSPDGHPIYDRSVSHPGAFVVNCHSGVTLAAAHADQLAAWILDEPVEQNLEAFSARRFQSDAA